MKYGFGVDLGGTTVKIAYFDEQGTILSKWEIPTITADGGKQILPDIAASICQFIEQKTIDPADVIGVGIGVPGPVNSKGVVNKCVNLGWGVFNIWASWLVSLSRPVTTQTLPLWANSGRAAVRAATT